MRLEVDEATSDTRPLRSPRLVCQISSPGDQYSQNFSRSRPDRDFDKGPLGPMSQRSAQVFLIQSTEAGIAQPGAVTGTVGLGAGVPADRMLPGIHRSLAIRLPLVPQPVVTSPLTGSWPCLEASPP